MLSYVLLMFIFATTGQSAIAQGAGFTSNPSAKNPVRCAQDKTAAATIQKEIDTLTSKRSTPQYSGPNSTLFTSAMRGLQTQAAATAQDEKTVCDGLTYTGSPTGPIVSIDAPTQPNGTKDGGPAPAGLTIAIAGSVPALYAVSLNGGVWKSAAGGSWTRLSRSPRYAHSIAIDPNNILHIAVGERADDAITPKESQVGLWESSDGGSNWTYSFNPLGQSGCTSQAIPSVVFDHNSSLFFATTCGVAHRNKGQTTISFGGNPSGVGAVTAVAASETKVWARTSNTLLVPQGDGSWKAKSIPTNMSPSNGAHDDFALAAFDGQAYFPCCDDSSYKPCGNLDDLVIYRTANDAFAFLPNIKNGKPLFGCSGQGLGGSRFVKAYSVKVGAATQKKLFYSSTEEIYGSVSVAADGGVSDWERPLGASCGGCTNQDAVHSDFWDFLLAPDGQTEWIANDGGVYQRSLSPAGSWLMHDQGLYTQHAHTLTLAAAPGVVHLLYPTSDNDAWFSNASGWDRENSLGDVNWSTGDAGNANVALAVRRSGSCSGQSCAMLTGFGASLPGGQTLKRAQLIEDGSHDGPSFFAVIQSLSSETPSKYQLDAVMLAKLPLQYSDGSGLHDVQGSLGVSAGSLRGALVLLRNPDFVSTPDIDSSKGQGWSLFADNLPAGASRIWLSGGHANPSAYVMSNDSSGARLFKAFHVPIGGNNQPTSWTELSVQGNVLQPKPFPPSKILDGTATFGPVFPNPYSVEEVFVLTSSGIMASVDGGFNFAPDASLTKLITSGGKYPLTGAFAGGNASDVKLASRAVPMGTLANICFDRNNPKIAVAASPFAGVFVRNASGSWFDLSASLPQPLPVVSDARLNGDDIYISTEGGGIIHIEGYPDLISKMAPASK